MKPSSPSPPPAPRHAQAPSASGPPHPVVVGYCRVSTDEQTKGWSLETQEKAIRAWADQQGYRVQAVFQDPGRSAGSLRGRLGLCQVLRTCDQGGIGTVVVWRLDRLARRVHLSRQTIRAIHSTGCHLVALEPFSQMAPMADGQSGEHASIQQTMMEILADAEQQTIRDRVIPAMTTAFRAGRRGGRVPLGYRLVEKGTFIVDPPMQRLMERAFREVAGGMGVSALVKRLAAEGVVRPDGRPITFDQMLWSLQNRFYLGELVYVPPIGQGADRRRRTSRSGIATEGSAETGRLDAPQQVIPGHHPALVDALTFAQVQQQMAMRRRDWLAQRPGRMAAAESAQAHAQGTQANAMMGMIRQMKDRRTQHPLDRVLTQITPPRIAPVHGIVPPTVARCGFCEERMHARLQTCGAVGRRIQVPVYICHRHKQEGAAVCPQKPAPVEDVDEEVRREVFHAIADRRFAHLLPTFIRQPQRTRPEDRQHIANLETQIGRLEALGRTHPKTVTPTLIARRQELERELALLRTRLAADATPHMGPAGPLGRLLHDPKGTWPSLSMMERREVIGSLVRCVRIHERSVQAIELMVAPSLGEVQP